MTTERGKAILGATGIHLVLLVIIFFQTISIEQPPPKLIEVDLAMAGVLEGTSPKPDEPVASPLESMPPEASPETPAETPPTDPTPEPVVPPSPERVSPPPSKTEPPAPSVESIPDDPVTSEVETPVPDSPAPVLPQRRGVIDPNRPKVPQRNSASKLPVFDLPTSDVPEVINPSDNYVPPPPPPSPPTYTDTIGIPERTVSENVTGANTPPKGRPEGETTETTREEGVTFSLEGVILRRNVLKHVIPDYPSGAAGSPDIKLKFEVTPDGAVTNIIPLSKGGDSRFERVAITALRQWRFGALQHDSGENQTGMITFKFRTR